MWWSASIFGATSINPIWARMEVTRESVTRMGTYRDREIEKPSDETDFTMGTMYSISYHDRAGELYQMTATYLGDHKFGGPSWSLRPTAGIKNLAEGSILCASAVPDGTDPVSPHPSVELNGT